MAGRIVLNAVTTFNLGTHLDPMTLDLYGIADYFRTPGYVGSNWAVAIDSSGRAIFGATAAAAFGTVTPSVQNLGTSINASALGLGIWQSASSSGTQLLFGKSRSGTVNSHSSGIVSANDVIVRAGGFGSDGSAFQECARWQFVVEGTPSAGVVDGRFSVYTALSGTVFERLRVDSSGHTSPGSDNAYSCGVSARRWSVVYAATGTINTSDARDKTAVRPLTEAELAAAKDLAREIGAYRFLDAMAKKGADAREHAGLTVQRAIEVMQSHGLEPLRYGFICHDSWPASVEPAEYRQRDTGMVDGRGQPIQEQVLVRAERRIPAGDRYSFRPDELNLFLARGFEARLSALEAAA